MPSARRLARLLSGVAALALITPVLSQITGDAPFGSLDFPGQRPPARRVELPRMGFELLADIPLPGPLPGGAPQVTDDGRVRIPVAGATALTRLDPGATPQLLSPAPPAVSPEPAAASAWVHDPRGRRRFRTTRAGLVQAQKCCSWYRKGWRRTWTLRVPAGIAVPPLVLDRRVFVGALDNQIYALRPRNGHRIWTIDVGQRVTRPLALWQGDVPVTDPRRRDTRERPVKLILVALDAADSSKLLAVDAATGATVASLELPGAEGRLVGAPATTPEGRVVVARQRYTRSEATLMVFRLEPLDEPAGPPPARKAGRPDARPQDAAAPPPT